MKTQSLEYKFVASLGAVAMFTTMVMPHMALAATLNDFTQNELDTTWVTDRQYPSGGVTSVTAHDRDNVAAIGVLGAEQSTVDSFYYYEGIKKVGDFGDEVSVDLYVPEEWEHEETSPRNVGMWVSDSPLSAYPIITFRNGDDVDAGFYTYNYVFDEEGEFVEAEYVLSSVPVEYGEWNTLTVIRDAENESFIYLINGEEAGRMDDVFGSIGDFIEQVYLNHYNSGDLDYTAHWHAGFSDPATKKACMTDGWEAFGFQNQGKCIQFVNTGKDSR